MGLFAIAMLDNQRWTSPVLVEQPWRATQGIQSLSGGIDLPSPEPTDVDLRNQTLNDVAKATARALGIETFKTALLILLIGEYMLLYRGLY